MILFLTGGMLTTLFIRFMVVRTRIQIKILLYLLGNLFTSSKRYFDDIDCVIGDEAHLFKSKSLTGIMTKLHNAKYRLDLLVH